MKNLITKLTGGRKASIIAACLLSLMMVLSVPLKGLAVADTVYSSGTYTVHIYVNGAYWHGVTYTFSWASKPSWTNSYSKSNNIYISGGDQWMGSMTSPIATSKTAADGGSNSRFVFISPSIGLGGLSGYHYQTYGRSQEAVRNNIAAISNTGITFAFNTAAVGLKTSDNVRYNGQYMNIYFVSNTGFVRYNSNGGGGSMADQSFAYGGGSVMTPNAFYKDGYEFAGWNTSPDGTGTAVGNGGAIPNAWALTDGQWTTVYAQWKKISQISYNANGGSLGETHGDGLLIDSDGSIRVNGSLIHTDVTDTFNLVKTNDPDSVNLARPGYHIDEGQEWCDASDGSGKVYDQSAEYVKGDFGSDTVLYANWKPNRYRIIFHPNAEGATGAMPDQFMTYDSDGRIQSNSFINPGFKLVGWDRDPDAAPEGSLDVRGDKGSASNLTSEQDGAVDLYAVWRPITDSETDIHAGKILKGSARTDEFTFRIEPVEGWKHENESTDESGIHIDAEDMPLPEDTPDGQRYKDVTVTGVAGNANVLRTQSFGLIAFEDPGWYMYRVSEVIPDEPDDKVAYDRTSYYVVAYVEYLEDEGYKVQVSNTTAWHNSEGSGRNRPTLDDISEITDNGGNAARANEENVFGKTDSGINSVVVRFWNEEVDDPDARPAALRIMKNVTGSLGDITKKFEFSARLSGLSPDTTYAVVNDGAYLDTGFIDSSFRTDSGGNASLNFRLCDDDNFYITGVPVGATASVTEYKSDHRPSYSILESGKEISSNSRRYESELGTGNFTLEKGCDYTVRYENNREIADNTGVVFPGRGVMAGGALITCILAASLIVIRKYREIRSEE